MHLFALQHIIENISSSDFSVLPLDTLTGRDLLYPMSRGHGHDIYCSLWRINVILNFQTLIGSRETHLIQGNDVFFSVACHDKIWVTQKVDA